MNFQGQCLCGDIQFQLHGTLDSFYCCHCTRCQRSSGSAYAGNLFFSDCDLTWNKGQALVRHYTHEGTRFAKQFCPHCASPLPITINEKKKVVQVPAGCLEGDQSFQPTAHIFTDNKKSWELLLADAPTFNQLPK